MNADQYDSLMSVLSSAGLPVLGLIAFSLIGLVAVNGYSMKFALAVSGVGRFSFWKSIGVSLVASLAVFFVSCSMAIAMAVLEGESLVVMLLSMFLSVTSFAFVVATIGRCGIIRGYLTYFLNGLFGVIGLTMLAIVVAGVVIVAAPYLQVDEQALATLRETMRDMEDPDFEGIVDESEFSINSLQNVSFFEGSEADEDPATDVKPSPLGRFGASPGKSIEPADHSNESVQDAFYEPAQGSEPNRKTGDVYSQPASTGVQSNPFVN